MTNLKKKYCIKCRYLDIPPNGGDNQKYVCFAPENMEVKHTWLKRIYTHVKSPEKINKNNNCQWYTEKDGAKEVTKKYNPKTDPAKKKPHRRKIKAKVITKENKE